MAKITKLERLLNVNKKSKFYTLLKKICYRVLAIVKFLFKALIVGICLYVILSNPGKSCAQDWNETILTELMNFYVYFVIYCPIK